MKPFWREAFYNVIVVAELYQLFFSIDVDMAGLLKYNIVLFLAFSLSTCDFFTLYSTLHHTLAKEKAQLN